MRNALEMLCRHTLPNALEMFCRHTLPNALARRTRSRWSVNHCMITTAKGAGPRKSAGLVDQPGVAAAEEGGQVAFALPGDRVVELLAHQLVVRRAAHLAEYADRGVLEARRVEPRQRERPRGVGVVRVVDHDAV